MPAVGRLRRERHLGSHGECAVCAEQDHRSTGTAVAPPAVDHKRPVSDRAGAFIARAAYGVDAHGKLSPSSRCQPTGVPAAATVPLPWKIIQTPQVILILYEENNIFRQVFLDGRPLPKDPDPRWMGYSVGRWEGDTLVVDSTGFRDGGWLDRMGHPHSSDLHVIERFRRPDVGHLEIDVTIDDSKAYSKRITYTQRQTLIPDEDLLEYFCTENEKDREHFK